MFYSYYICYGAIKIFNIFTYIYTIQSVPNTSWLTRPNRLFLLFRLVDYKIYWIWIYTSLNEILLYIGYGLMAKGTGLTIPNWCWCLVNIVRSLFEVDTLYNKIPDWCWYFSQYYPWLILIFYAIALMSEL